MSNGFLSPEEQEEIIRKLIAAGVTPADPEFRVRFNAMRAAVVSGSITDRSSLIDIKLPDLEDGVVAEIIPENLSALSAVYFAAMLEELKFFATAERIAEQFMSGMVPIIKGEAGRALYEFIRNEPTRLFNEAQRRSLYARAFGLAQGAVDEPMPNREFSDLWIRFLSNVSLANRQSDFEKRLVSDQQVFKSARDLGVNLSLHGYGVAHFAAVELQSLIEGHLALMREREVLDAYGVRDVWQLVERVSGLYLGGSVNSVRQRTLAEAGSFIIAWLADQASLLSQPRGIASFRLDARDRNKPEELEKLIDAVERWLAVTGSGDDVVTRFSEPVAVQAQPTIPNLALQGLTANVEDLLQQMPGVNGAPIAQA